MPWSGWAAWAATWRGGCCAAVTAWWSGTAPTPRRRSSAPRAPSRSASSPTSWRRCRSRASIWLMLPYGDTTQDGDRRARRRCSPRATSSSTAATRRSSTTSSAAPRSPSTASATSTPAPAAASGASRSATASWSAASASAFEHIEPLLATLAPPGHGYEYWAATAPATSSRWSTTASSTA